MFLIRKPKLDSKIEFTFVKFQHDLISIGVQRFTKEKSLKNIILEKH